jgi:hypothetical protein
LGQVVALLLVGPVDLPATRRAQSIVIKLERTVSPVSRQQLFPRHVYRGRRLRFLGSGLLQATSGKHARLGQEVQVGGVLFVVHEFVVISVELSAIVGTLSPPLSSKDQLFLRLGMGLFSQSPLLFPKVGQSSYAGYAGLVHRSSPVPRCTPWR